MSRKVFAVLALASMAGKVTSCSPAPEPSGEPSALADLISLPGFSPLDSCSEPPAQKLWQTGETFTTEFVQGGVAQGQTLSRVIREEAGTVWVSEERIAQGNERPFGSQRTAALHLGLFAAGHRSEPPQESWRQYTFPADMAERVRQLQVGESATFPVTEDTLFNDSPKTSSGEFTVTLLGCGDLAGAQGESRPVHVLEVEGFYRAYRAGPPPTDEVLSSPEIIGVDTAVGTRLFTGRADSWVVTRS